MIQIKARLRRRVVQTIGLLIFMFLWRMAYPPTIAVFTALSRVTLGKHYPSDVIAGASIGTAVGLAVVLAHEDGSGSEHQIQPTLGIRWSNSEGFGVYF